MTGPVRSIVPIVVILLVVVIVAVVVALVAAPDEAEQYPADSPEGTVQRYIQALQERDFDRAHDMLSERAQERTTSEDLRNWARFDTYDEGTRRVRLLEVDVDGDRATVRIEFEHTSGSGLDFSRYTVRRTVPLVMEDVDWKIDDPLAVMAWVRMARGAS
jgi:hypothetical protein